MGFSTARTSWRRGARPDGGRRTVEMRGVVARLLHYRPNSETAEARSGLAGGALPLTTRALGCTQVGACLRASDPAAASYSDGRAVRVRPGRFLPTLQRGGELGLLCI